MKKYLFISLLFVAGFASAAIGGYVLTQATGVVKAPAIERDVVLPDANIALGDLEPDTIGMTEYFVENNGNIDEVVEANILVADGLTVDFQNWVNPVVVMAGERKAFRVEFRTVELGPLDEDVTIDLQVEFEHITN